MLTHPMYLIYSQLQIRLFPLQTVSATISSTKSSPKRVNSESKIHSVGYSTLTSPVSSLLTENRTSHGATWYSSNLKTDPITSPTQKWTANTTINSTMQTNQSTRNPLSSKFSSMITTETRTTNAEASNTPEMMPETQQTNSPMSSTTKTETTADKHFVTSMGSNYNLKSVYSTLIPSLSLSSFQVSNVTPSSSLIKPIITESSVSQMSTDINLSSSKEHRSSPQTNSFKSTTIKSPISSTTYLTDGQTMSFSEVTTEHIQSSKPANGMQTPTFTSEKHSVTPNVSLASLKSTYEINTAYSTKVKNSFSTLLDLSTAKRSSMLTTITSPSKPISTPVTTVSSEMSSALISSTPPSTTTTKTFTTITTIEIHEQTTSLSPSGFFPTITTVKMATTSPKMSEPLTTEQKTVVMNTSNLMVSSPSSSTTTAIPFTGKHTSSGSSASERSTMGISKPLSPYDHTITQPSPSTTSVVKTHSSVFPSSEATDTTKFLTKLTMKRTSISPSSLLTETSSEPTTSISSSPILSHSVAWFTSTSLNPESSMKSETSSATSTVQHDRSRSNESSIGLTTVIIRETPTPTRKLLSRSAGVIAGVCSVSATFIIIISIFCYFKIKSNKKKPWTPLDDRIEVPTNNIAIKMDMIVKEYELPPDDTENNRERQLNHI